MGAGTGEHVEGVLSLIHLLFAEGAPTALIEERRTVALSILAIREDLRLPRNPDGAVHTELLAGGAALLLELRLPVDLFDGEFHIEDFWLSLRHLADRPDLKPVIGTARYVRVSQNVYVDDRTQNERHRWNRKNCPDDRAQHPEAQEISPG